MLVALKNRLNKADNYDTEYGGVNISATYLTQELVDSVKSKGKTLGVWVAASVLKEDETFWRRVFSMRGIDFFYSDFPIEAMKVRDEPPRIILHGESEIVSIVARLQGIEYEQVESTANGVVLEVPGVKLHNEMAIARFFATESSLLGTTPNQQTLVDQWIYYIAGQVKPHLSNTDTLPEKLLPIQHHLTGNLWLGAELSLADIWLSLLLRGKNMPEYCERIVAQIK